MEEVGDRTTVFEFGGLRDRQRDYIDWVLKCSIDEGVDPDEVITDETAMTLAAKLKTPLQIGRHLVRAFEAGSKRREAGRCLDRRDRPVAADRRPRAAAHPHGYDVKVLCDHSTPSLPRSASSCVAASAHSARPSCR